MAREESFEIRSELTRGLRRDFRIGRGALDLIECLNFRPTEFGLKNVPRVGGSIYKGIWPFPQLFVGKAVTLLADSDTIYEVSEDWVETPLTTYDAFDRGTLKSISVGGPWHFIDMRDDWVLLNGECMVFKYKGKVLVQDSVTVKAGCEFQGRLLLGGFNQDDFWSDGWKGFFRHWTTLYGDSSIQFNLRINKSSILYSPFGYDYKYWFLYPDEAVYSNIPDAYDMNNPFILELFDRGDVGISNMNWQGDILYMAPLRNHVVVYGRNNITALSSFDADAAIMLRKDEIMSQGVLGRGSVVARPDFHFFVDSAGYLWRLGADLKLEALGYREYLAQDNLRTLMLSYDDIENDAYICSDNKGFVYTGSGLGQISYSVTSLTTSDGTLRGVASGNVAGASLVRSSVFDLGLRGIKTIHSVEVGAQSFDGVEVQVDYRMDKGSFFSRTDWEAVDLRGKAATLVDGVEFRVAVRAPAHTDLEIDYIRVNWRQRCKRNLSALLS